MEGHPEVWQRLIDQAGPPADGEAGTLSLASAGDAAKEGVERLTHTGNSWVKAAAVSGDIEVSLRQAGSLLKTSHTKVVGEGRGLSSIKRLGPVRTSWERRLRDAEGECGSLETRLKKVAAYHAENDGRTGASFEDRGAGPGGDRCD